MELSEPVREANRHYWLAMSSLDVLIASCHPIHAGPLHGALLFTAQAFDKAAAESYLNQ